jgi:hypothetical protein
MAQKPNYNFQRAERDRAKKAKKEEKLQEKKQAALREAQGSASGGSVGAEPEPDVSVAETPE